MYFLKTNDERYRIGIDEGYPEDETHVLFKPVTGGPAVKLAGYPNPDTAQRAAMDSCSKYNDAVREGFEMVLENETYLLIHAEGYRLPVSHLTDLGVYAETFVEILQAAKMKEE